MEGQEVALAREIHALEAQREALAAQEKALKARYDAKCAELQNYLVQEGKTSTGHIEGVGVFAIRRSNYPSVSQDRMPMFLDYLRKTDNAGLIVETVPAQTLKKFCKDKLEELTEAFIEDPESAETALDFLGLPKEEALAPAELAKLYMERFGVKTFQEIKLSHTARGK